MLNELIYELFQLFIPIGNRRTPEAKSATSCNLHFDEFCKYLRITAKQASKLHSSFIHTRNCFVWSTRQSIISG